MNKKFLHVDSYIAKDLLKNLSITLEEDVTYYSHFDLLSPRFFVDLDINQGELGCQYLFLLENDKIIGAIKWKRYSIPHHQFVSEDDTQESYVAIRLVDIHENYRQKGYAKELVKYWGIHCLKENDLVVGGKETNSGAESNIHHWISNTITQKYYKSEITLVEDWEEENYIF